MKTEHRKRSIRLGVIAVIWAAALVGALFVIWPHLFSEEPAPTVLGEEYSNEEFKFSMRPPANWKKAEMPADKAEIAASGRPLTAVQFIGRRPGDKCSLFVYRSQQPLKQIAAATLKNIPPKVKPDCRSGFYKHKGLPAWRCEMILKQDVVLHQLSVAVKRGDILVFVNYAAVQTSYSRQREAIEASLGSLTFR